MTVALTGWLLGAWLGARHALEPDHLAALSTLLSDSPRSRTAALLGAAWGLGHTIALLLVALVLVGLRTQLPETAIAAAEATVALMLIALGARNLVRAFRAGKGGAPTLHEHGGRWHRHAGPDHHVHLGGWTLARRPLAVGLVHGLAGSGGLTALAVSGMPTPASALVYVLLFGLGSIAGMAVLSLVAGASIERLARSPRAQTALVGATGLLSLVVGVLWGAPAVAALV